MPYKKFACKKMINETHLFVYLYNDCGELDDLNGRPAFTHSINDIVVDEQYYSNNFCTADINRPHNVSYYKRGNISSVYKQAEMQTYFNKINHTNISSAHFDNDGNITCQTHYDVFGCYYTEYFKEY